MKRIRIFPALAVILTLTLLATALPAVAVSAQTITRLYPNRGRPGTTINIVGYDFSGAAVEIYFSKGEPQVGYFLDDYVNAYEWLAETIPFTDQGTFGVIDTDFKIPAELTLGAGNVPAKVRNGTYWVSVTSTSQRVRAAIRFLVEGTGEIELTPTSGSVGTSVRVNGVDFGNQENLTVEYNGATIAIASGEAATNSRGEFDFTFTVPKSAAGKRKITVTGRTSATVAENYFTVKPRITLNPTSGPAGIEVTVAGTGLGYRSGISFVNFGLADITNSITGDRRADSNGNLGFTFIVPEGSAGIYTLLVEDEDGYSSSAEFTRMVPNVVLSANTGYVGTKITVGGIGFRVSQGVIITFKGLEVARATSDADGNFSTDFTIPSGVTGTYKVGASDGLAENSQDFTILASLSLSQTMGYSGTEVTATGHGFKANRAIVVVFDNNLVVTANSDASGSFTTPFKVPARNLGNYKVQASDDISIAEANFAVTSNASISPQTSAAAPGYVGTEITISGQGFASNRTIVVTYDDNPLATAVVNAEGTFLATFKAPPSRGGEHRVIATEGTTAWPFTFVMETTTPAIPQPLKPEMGMRAKAKAYFDWGDVTDPSGVTYVFQIATNANFPANLVILEKTGLTSSEYTLTPEESLKSVSEQTPYYYWHVKAVDGASNESGWSSTGSFAVGFALETQHLIYILIGIGVIILALLGYVLGRRAGYRAGP